MHGTGLLMRAGKFVRALHLAQRLPPQRWRPATRAVQGFSYPIVMFALVTFGLGLAAFGESWERQANRDKERELIRTGAEVAQAIERYYLRSPGTIKTFPGSLEDLLEDKRFPGIERHLRRLPRDPFTRKQAWGIVTAPDGGIAGIYSLHNGKPLTTVPVVAGPALLEPAERYDAWKFIFNPDRLTGKDPEVSAVPSFSIKRS